MCVSVTRVYLAVWLLCVKLVLLCVSGVRIVCAYVRVYTSFGESGRLVSCGS